MIFFSDHEEVLRRNGETEIEKRQQEQFPEWLKNHVSTFLLYS